MRRGSKAPSIAKRSSLAGAQVNTHTHKDIATTIIAAISSLPMNKDAHPCKNSKAFAAAAAPLLV